VGIELSQSTLWVSRGFHAGMRYQAPEKMPYDAMPIFGESGGVPLSGHPRRFQPSRTGGPQVLGRNREDYYPSLRTPTYFTASTDIANLHHGVLGSVLGLKTPSRSSTTTAIQNHHHIIHFRLFCRISSSTATSAKPPPFCSGSALHDRALSRVYDRY